MPVVASQRWPTGQVKVQAPLRVARRLETAAARVLAGQDRFKILYHTILRDGSGNVTKPSPVMHVLSFNPGRTDMSANRPVIGAQRPHG